MVVVMFSLLTLVDLDPDILHMARVKPLSEKACEMSWGDSFNMKSLLCTDAAASTSCLVQSYNSFNTYYSHALGHLISLFCIGGLWRTTNVWKKWGLLPCRTNNIGQQEMWTSESSCVHSSVGLLFMDTNLYQKCLISLIKLY